MSFTDLFKKIAKGVSTGVEIADIFFDIKSIAGFKRFSKDIEAMRGKEEGEGEGKVTEEVKKIKRKIADLDRADEMIKSFLLINLVGERRRVCMRFLRWLQKQNPLKSRLLRVHFNEEYEFDDKKALEKLEDLVDVVIDHGHKKALEYCDDMEYTRDSTYDFLSAASKKVMEVGNVLGKKVDKRFEKHARETLQRQQDILEAKKRLKKKNRKR